MAGLNDYLHDGTVAHTWGQNTFRLFFAVASALGANVSAKPIIMEFRWAPIQTNVYTVLRNYFEDFGWAGVVAIQAAFGFLHTVFWVRARQGLESAAFFYGVMFFCLIMQVFQDNYLNSLSLWGQGAILLWLLRPRPRQPPGGEATPYAEPGPAAAG